LSNKINNVNDHVDRLIKSALVFYNIVLAITLVIIVYKIINKIKGDFKAKGNIVLLLILITPIIPIAISAREKNSKFGEYLKSIKSEDSQFIANIKNDKKYFCNSINTDGYTEFNKLTLDEKRKLKIYYSTYKNKETTEDKKTQSQKDYEQFLRVKENEDNLYSYLDDFKT